MSEQKNDAAIWVMAVDDDAVSQDRAFGFRQRKKISVETLREQLGSFVVSMDAALRAVPQQVAEFDVEELTLSLEVGASGTVSLIGSGATVSGTGGVTLKLRKRDPKR